jgi:hypothetical protein
MVETHINKPCCPFRRELVVEFFEGGGEGKDIRGAYVWRIYAGIR